MLTIAKKTLLADFEIEMRQSYLDYAMSVIVGRALPDIRDGLKPVHRRILYAMHDMGNNWNKPYKKSARITGDVIGKYHPHGDSAIYDAIVRMAQDFSMRYPLVDGQGNFGSVDGDTPAAMRYTEVRLSRIAHELMSDIEKETVNFGPNYDETEEQPLVLPTRLPNLLLNGSEGIAVGMATKIPPHNLTETINACLALIDNPDISIHDLIVHMPGPDFPTRGIINGRSGIIEAYRGGRGIIRVRGKVDIESSDNGKQRKLVITELPYAIKKAPLVEHIAALANTSDIHDPLNGIAMVRDESDKSGLRVVVKLKAKAVPKVVENNLYSKTKLESTYGINFVVVDNGKPQRRNLKQLLNGFIRHRREVVTRRLEYELRAAQRRAHLLEGFTVALSNLDELLDMIRSENKSRSEIKKMLLGKGWDANIVLKLLGNADNPEQIGLYVVPNFGIRGNSYWLSEKQAEAILDMRLHRLSGLEQQKIFEEFKKLLETIEHKKRLLGSSELLMKEIREELEELRDKYGKNDERRTQIIATEQDVENEDLITKEDVIVTLTAENYAKQQPTKTFKTQHKGGKGKFATKYKEGDSVNLMLSTSTHDTLVCFTNFGKAYLTRPFKLERGSPIAKGSPLVNTLALQTDEKVSVIEPLNTTKESKFIVMATRFGKIKRCELDLFDSLFKKQWAKGLKAISLSDSDELVNVAITNGDSDILIFSSAGRAVRFSESDLRPTGRTAMGVRAIKLQDDQEVCSMVIVTNDEEDHNALIVDESGFGKRTKFDQFPKKSRGTKGVYALSKKKRESTKLKQALKVRQSDEVMFITNNGLLLRTEVRSISQLNRITGGVRLIHIAEDDSLVSVAPVWQSQDPNSKKMDVNYFADA